MWTRGVCLSIFIWTFFTITSVLGCTIPTSLIGTWSSSDKGTIQLNETHLIDYSIYNKGPQTFECFDQTGNYYSFKTTAIGLFSSTAIAALCIEFQSIATGVYKYIIKTAQLSQADNERFMYATTSTSLTTSLVCDDTSNVDFHFLFDPNLDLSTIATSCPSMLQDHFSYVSNITTPGECNGTGSLDICTDKTAFNFNYTSCSTMQAYSSGGELNCFFTENYGSYTKVMLYNRDSSTDETTTFKIMCYMFESASDGNIYGTQHPTHCYTGQTPYVVDSDGGYIILTAEETCPVTAEASTGLTAAASAGIAIAVFLIFLILILLIAFCIWKKTRKVEPGPPDQGVPPAETKMPDAANNRPDLVRNTKSARIFTTNEMPEVESREKIPRLEREVTQNSNLRQQIITPSVVNPMVREWTDMDDSDNMTLIGSENMHLQLDPPSPFPHPLTPVEESSRYMDFLHDDIDYSSHERTKKKKKKKVKKKKKKK